MCNFLWFLSIIPITSYVQGFGMHGEQLIERKERALLFPQSSTIGVSWFIIETIRFNIKDNGYCDKMWI